MKQIVLTCLGLIGLSAAGGAALFASHSALAAGPKLPDYVVRAHAVAASRPAVVAPAETQSPTYEVMQVSLSNSGANNGGWPPVVDPEITEAMTAPVMVFSTQDRNMGLAPVRVLRPMARPDAYSTVAQASTNAPIVRNPVVRNAVSSNRSTVTSLQPNRTTQRALTVRRLLRSQPVAAQRRNSGTIDPGYLHGVFR